MASLFSPPGMPSALAGFLDLRGAAIPILRLDQLFTLPEQPAGLHTPLLILQGIPLAFGLLVEAVHQIIPITPDFLRPLPEKQVFHGCATALVEINGEVIHLLSVERLLLENERCKLAEFQTAVQGRLRRLTPTAEEA